MGLLDHVPDPFHGPAWTARFLRRNLKTAEKLLTDGDRASARIVGIRIRTHTDEPDDNEFALEYAAGASVVRAGCRQRLGPLQETVRLGMEVPVRHDGDGRAIIDVPAMGGAPDDGAWGWKSVDPPSDGVEDDRSDLAKERRKAVAARVTIRSVEPYAPFGIPTQNYDLRVRVEPGDGAPYDTVVKRELIPYYAAHLADPGTVVPGLARPTRPDKVRIDWPAAVLAEPGIGRPPAPAFTAPNPAGPS